MKIKIFGERNTATNALTALIRKNSKSVIFPGSIQEVDANRAREISIMRQAGISLSICEDAIDQFFQDKSLLFQWKHTATNFDAIPELDDVMFLFTVRHPLSWLYSLFKNPYHMLSKKSRTFENFISQEWKTLKRDNVETILCTPIDLYKIKLLSYVNFISFLNRSRIPYFILKFEDIISSQKLIFQKIRDHLDSPSKQFEYHTESTKDKMKNLEFYRNYYQLELWKKEIDIKIVNEFQFDKTLLKYFGY